jgi:hypothetical protein
MAIIPDFDPVTNLDGVDELTAWDNSEAGMVRITVDDFVDNVIGDTFQPRNSNLTTIASFDHVVGNTIISDGTSWVIENDALIISSDQDLTISSKGTYLFFGSTPRTWTINDGIIGQVEIRTLASVDLTLTASLPTSHLGTIYSGTPVQFLKWSQNDSLYTY